MFRTSRSRRWILALIAARSALAVAGAMPGTGAARKGARVTAGLPYQNPDLPISARVDDLLSRMTPAEKIGQMTQAERGSVDSDPSKITNDNLGSLLSGGGSVPTPNTPTAWADMVDRYQQAALNTRLHIPLLYGIDTVHGDGNMYGATVFPHNIGLGASRDPALVRSVMPSYSDVDWTEDGLGNRINMHGNRDLITGWLKDKIGFDGFLISDYNGIDHINPEKYTFAQKVAAGVNAGIDMFMQPQNFHQFESTLTGLVMGGQVPMTRIDDAVRRILTKKFELGLFEHPFTDRRY